MSRDRDFAGNKNKVSIRRKRILKTKFIHLSVSSKHSSLLPLVGVSRGTSLLQANITYFPLGESCQAWFVLGKVPPAKLPEHLASSTHSSEYSFS